MTNGRGEILVVDDDPLNRAILRRALEREGHGVAAAEDGVEALAAMRAGDVDLVLLDIVMPRMDGFQVLAEMKGDAGLRDIPVIMISAVDDHESVIRCIELGAEDHLPKPFDPVLLRARINAGLARKRLHMLERERLHDTFARFLPEGVVEEVLRRGGSDPRLGGVRLDATVMFCDLRGFTSFAERTPPDRVIDVLNRYLGEMTDAVLDAGGTSSASWAMGSWRSSARPSRPPTMPTARWLRPAPCSRSACRVSTRGRTSRASATASAWASV